MTGKPLGIGVVGAGRWANLAHLPGWARDDCCRIVGICDREPDRAAAAAARFGAPVVTGDYSELLARDDIDIIDVITPHFIGEVLGEIDGNKGNFEDAIWVQEVVNAVEISHHERRWVGLSLDGS